MLSDDQKKMLTEKLLWECCHEWINDSYNFPKCHCSKCEIDLTELFGDGNRTFLTWQDLGDCKEALVKKGLGEEFIKFCYNKWVYPDTQVKINPATILAIRSSANFDLWLFRPTDEKGEAHFCRLVAEFMEKFVKQN